MNMMMMMMINLLIFNLNFNEFSHYLYNLQFADFSILASSLFTCLLGFYFVTYKNFYFITHIILKRHLTTLVMKPPCPNLRIRVTFDMEVPSP